MEKILLCLNGKRIEFAKVVEDEDESFDWVAAAYPAAPNRDYLLIDYKEDQYQLAITGKNYYDAKAKKIKAMTKTEASVDRESIENDGLDVVEYKVKASEAMDIIVHQGSGTLRENAIFALQPMDGWITIRITSDMLGILRLAAIGDTMYTDPIDVSVV